jgi:hypothetical protein
MKKKMQSTSCHNKEHVVHNSAKNHQDSEVSGVE